MIIPHDIKLTNKNLHSSVLLKHIMRIVLVIVFSFLVFNCRTEPEKKSLTDRLERKLYINKELSEFCRDFQDSIKSPIFINEPPGKLSGINFPVSDDTYFSITLYDIPDSAIFRENLNWKIKEIEDCKIKSIELERHGVILFKSN